MTLIFHGEAGSMDIKQVLDFLEREAARNRFRAALAREHDSVLSSGYEEAAEKFAHAIRLLLADTVG